MLYRNDHYFSTCGKKYFGKEYKDENGKRKVMLLHRRVWEDHYGPIPPNYHVHHKDGNTLNNNIDNLEIIHKATHVHMHRMMERDEGRITEIKEQAWRNRKFVSRVCNECSAGFRTKWPQTKYCSNLCSQRRRQRLKDRMGASGPQICETCGKTKTNPHGTLYCSRKCYFERGALKEEKIA